MLADFYFGGGLQHCFAVGWVLRSPPWLPGCHGDVFSAGELKQKGVALATSESDLANTATTSHKGLEAL